MSKSKLKPFFCLFGGKWRVAPRIYPSPKFDTIIEPFAGGAGYSVRYPQAHIKLYDANPRIFGLWSYLISVKASEILKLPLIVDHVDNFQIPQESKWLIGFWMNKGNGEPRPTPGSRMRRGARPNSDWGEVIRARIAEQVQYIRHWKIKQCDYLEIPNERATWFIDPPYNNPAGKEYKCQVASYAALAKFCKTRKGQIIACENTGADWLPFQEVAKIKGREKPSSEAIWIGENL